MATIEDLRKRMQAKPKEPTKLQQLQERMAVRPSEEIAIAEGGEPRSSVAQESATAPFRTVSPFMGMGEALVGGLGWLGQEALERPKETALAAWEGADQLARSLAEGMSFGTADEFAARMGDVTGTGPGSSYEENLAIERAKQEEIPTRTRLLGNLAGGAAVIPLIPGSAPQTLKGVMGLGGGLGALSGFGHGEGGVANRLVSAGEGATLGAATSGLLKGGTTTIGALVDRMRQGVDRPTAAALDRVLKEMNAGQITPQQAIKKIQRLGPEGMLADVPELQRLAQQTATQTTAGQRIAQSALEQRTGGASDRVNQVLDIAFGSPVPGGVGPPLPLHRVRELLIQAQRNNAAPIYEQALSVGPLKRTKELTKLIGGIEEGGANLAKMRGGGEKGSSLVLGAIENIRRTNPRFRGLPNTDPRLLHAARVQLAERSVGIGAPKRNVNDVVQQLTDAMEGAGAKGYREAVNQYKSDSAIIEAFDRGRKALNDLPENVETFLSGAAEGERQAFMAGLGRQITRDLETGTVGSATSAINRLFKGERGQILKDSLGQSGFTKFRDRLLRELRFAETNRVVRGGSPTEPRQAAMREQFERLGRLERAGSAIREGRGMLGAGAELARAAESASPNLDTQRALAQLLFRSRGQGLGSGRFAAGQTPLTELVARQRLLGGGEALGPQAQKSAATLLGAEAGLVPELLMRRPGLME